MTFPLLFLEGWALLQLTDWVSMELLQLLAKEAAGCAQGWFGTSPKLKCMGSPEGAGGCLWMFCFSLEW